MVSDISIIMAFTAGLASFLSPCVLPLVPGYISFISGHSLQSMMGEKENGEDSEFIRGNRVIILNSLFFITGFSMIFIILGASSTWLGALLVSKMTIVTKIAGLIIIFFGLLKMGIIRLLLFKKEAKLHIQNRRFGYPGALLIGASFAFGWTPCVGPILAGILVYAGTLKHIHQGIILLFIYSMGLGIPFLITALGINHFFRFFNRIKKHLGLIEKTFGLIMIILGLLIFTNKLFWIAGYLTFFNKFAL